VPYSYIFKNEKEIEAIPTHHLVGKKQILAKKENCKSNLTQAALGYLKKDEIIEEHFHSTMEEFYFFLSGNSIFTIENDSLQCKKGDFLMVPAKSKHFIRAIEDTSFIYWGIGV